MNKKERLVIGRRIGVWKSKVNKSGRITYERILVIRMLEAIKEDILSHLEKDVKSQNKVGGKDE